MYKFKFIVDFLQLKYIPPHQYLVDVLYQVAKRPHTFCINKLSSWIFTRSGGIVELVWIRWSLGIDLGFNHKAWILNGVAIHPIAESLVLVYVIHSKTRFDVRLKILGEDPIF